MTFCVKKEKRKTKRKRQKTPAGSVTNGAFLFIVIKSINLFHFQVLSDNHTCLIDLDILKGHIPSIVKASNNGRLGNQLSNYALLWVIFFDLIKA